MKSIIGFKAICFLGAFQLFLYLTFGLNMLLGEYVVNTIFHCEIFLFICNALHDLWLPWKLEYRCTLITLICLSYALTVLVGLAAVLVIPADVTPFGSILISVCNQNVKVKSFSPVFYLSICSVQINHWFNLITESWIACAAISLQYNYLQFDLGIFISPLKGIRTSLYRILKFA